MSDDLKDTAEEIAESEEAVQLDADLQMPQDAPEDDDYFRELSELQMRIKASEQELRDMEQELQDMEHQSDMPISEQKSSDLVTKLEKLEGGTTVVDDLKGIAKDAVKKVAAAPVTITVQAVKSSVKSAISKANPFDQKINKNDVTDSGVESVRLAYTSVKQAKNSIKTVGHTVKTTQRTIKTAGSAAKTTVKIAYKTPIYIVKTAVKAVRWTATVAANIVAALMNPVVIIIIAVLCFLLFLILGISVILFGGDTADKSAATGAIGLVEVDTQYQNALNYFNIAVQSKKDAFYALIDSLYYNYPDDLTHSNLVYLERTDASGSKTTYETSFATDARKATLKSAWDFSEDDVRGIIAVAYVYLEKQENEAHGTESNIYEVTYTQEVFDMLAGQCVNFNEGVYGGQSCGTGCTRHVEVVSNPAYQVAWDTVETAVNAYNDWFTVVGLLQENSTIHDGTAQVSHWNNRVLPLYNGWIIKYNRYPTLTNNGNDFLKVLGSEYESAVQVRNSTPVTIEEVTYICENQHDLHSIGLWYYNKESIMNALGFTDNEKNWVSLTETGFESNPNIP